MRSPWAFFRDFFGSLFARAPGHGQDPRWQQRWVLPYPISGLALTADELMSLSAVWACIDVIATSIAPCPWNVYQHRKSGTRDLVDDDPLVWLLNTRPNPDMTAMGLREAMLFTAIPQGNSYAEIVRDGGGRVAQLWPLPPDRVTPRRHPETWELLYEYRQPDGELEYLTQREVLHIRGPGLHGLMGDNIIARAAKSMSVAAAQERHAAAYFGQGANPGGVLEVPGELSEKRHKQLQEDWAEKKKGPENAHKPMILEAGWKWTPIDTDAQKSQLVESRQFSVEEICRWFRVPPHKVQHLLRATFTNIEHQSIEFVRDALRPWCRRQEQEVDYKLIRQDRGPLKTTTIDTSFLLMGDYQSRAAGYAIMRQNGIMSGNEIRHREGMNPMGPDGDVYLVNGTLKPIDQAINPPPPPPALPAGDVDENDDNGEVDDNANEPDASPDATAREALRVLIAGALDRFARALSKRRADLEAKSPEKLESKLEVFRQQRLTRMLEELGEAQALCTRLLGRPIANAELERAVALLDAGEAPLSAAGTLLRAPSA